MTKQQINIIRSNWQLAAPNADIVGGLFYKRLFEIAPEVKPMFSRTPVPEQSKKLMAMLGYIISRLDRLEDIVSEIAALAQRHVKYGVEPYHYVVVGEVLLWTLEQGLGDAWNNEAEEAWSTCYSILCSAMVDSVAC